MNNYNLLVYFDVNINVSYDTKSTIFVLFVLNIFHIKFFFESLLWIYVNFISSMFKNIRWKLSFVLSYIICSTLDIITNLTIKPWPFTQFLILFHRYVFLLIFCDFLFNNNYYCSHIFLRFNLFECCTSKYSFSMYSYFIKRRKYS